METFIRTNDMKTDLDLFELIRRKLDAGEPVYIGAPILVSNVCHVLNTLERFKECVALVDRCFAALGSKPMQLLDRKLYAAVNGTLPSADDLVRDVMENPERWKSIQPRGIPMVLAACWFAKKRDRPRLLDALKLARKNGYRDFLWAKEDPGLAHYLDDREVKALF